MVAPSISCTLRMPAGAGKKQASAEELLTSASCIAHGAEPTALLGLLWKNANPPVQRTDRASSAWVMSKAGERWRSRRLRSQMLCKKGL